MTLEKKNARRWQKAQQEAIEARAMQVEELAALAQDKIALTKREHRSAASRANAANQRTKEVAERVLAHKTEHLLDRTEVVLQLKSDVNAVQAELLTKASKHRKKVQDGIML